MLTLFASFGSGRFRDASFHLRDTRVGQSDGEVGGKEVVRREAEMRGEMKLCEGAGGSEVPMLVAGRSAGAVTFCSSFQCPSPP